MAGRFELLVFDWDGTLADSIGQIVAVMMSAITDAEVEMRTSEQIRGIIGLGMHDALDALFPGLPGPARLRIAEAYRSRYRALGPGSVRLFPGTVDALDHLRSRGHLLAVATGKGRAGLGQALRDTGLETMFHATRTADESASKPSPVMLEQIMDQFAIAPERTLMIGDSEHDLRMAANAGVPAIAVASGARAAAGLLEFGPMACLDSVAQLPRWLDHQGSTPH